MAETDTGVAQGGLDKVIGDAIIAFNETNVMFPLVSVKQCPPGAITVQWPEYSAVASSAVGAATDGADYSTVTSITTTARTATVSEHVIRADVTDLAVMGNADDIAGNTGAILGNAVAAKLDNDLVTLGKSFSQTEAGAGTALTLDHIFGGLRQLRAANAPAPYNLVMSDKGIFGPKGLQGLLVDVAVTGSNAKPASLLGEQGQEFLSRGFVTSLGGIDIYFSNEIDDDVASGGDTASFMFSAGAMGLAVGPEGLMRIETERNASFRSTEYVATGFWGEVEVKDAFGVTILSDVS
jgi:hypothetical protein|tara:strand:+ start:20 stop:904 length:885 start_codon:yes stop_codon:yes gene_type:complete